MYCSVTKETLWACFSTLFEQYWSLRMLIVQSKHRFHFQGSSSCSLRSLQLWVYLTKITVSNRVQFYINQCNVDLCRASLHRRRGGKGAVILITMVLVLYKNQSPTYPLGLWVPSLIGPLPPWADAVLPRYLWKNTRSLILKISREHIQMNRWRGKGLLRWDSLVKTTPATGVESYK